MASIFLVFSLHTLEHFKNALFKVIFISKDQLIKDLEETCLEIPQAEKVVT